MKRIFLLLLIAAMAITSCSPKFDLAKQKQSSRSAYAAGNYEAALQKWEKIISWHKENGKAVPAEVYAEAGKAAYQFGNYDKAENYFKQAGWAGYEDPEMYRMMAELYRSRDNLSKEMDALINYTENFPEGKNIDEIQNRLFTTYVISENYEQALQLWDSLSADARNNSQNLERFFIANRELENEEVLENIARNILEKDEDNITALEFLAKEYFWKAENIYQEELQAYNKNKTHKQYKRLLNALDRVNANFQISLGYFKQLYEIEPKSSYAKYIGNIYNRFDDKGKADYWYGKAR